LRRTKTCSKIGKALHWHEIKVKEKMDTQHFFSYESSI